MKSFSALLISIVVLAAPVAAQDTLDWDINNLDEPVSLLETGNNSSTIQTVRLVNDAEGEPITPANFTSKEDFEYNYSGNISSMEHLQNGYWYANLTTIQENTTIEYQLVRSDGSSTIEENLTETLDVGNLSVELMNDFNGYVKPGEDVRLQANVTDTWNDTNEDDATVEAYVTNGTWTGKLGKLGYSPSTEEYSLQVEMPDHANSSYIIHINASASGQGYNKPYGSTSDVFDTYPRSTGKIAYLNASSGCDNSSFFTECGRNAEIETGYNMTAFEASDVELAVKAPLKNGTMRTLDTFSMDENSLWETEFQLPELNTSKYQEKVSMVYNASVNEDQLLTRYNVTYIDYRLSDASENSVQQTEDFLMRFSIEEPFTGNAVDLSEMEEVNATIYDPNGDIFRNYSIGEISFFSNTGFYGKNVYFSRDAENGTYRLNVTTTDSYNSTKSFEQPFNVGEVSSTFNTTDEIEFEFMDLLEHERMFNVTNQKSANLTLNVTLSEELENVTTVNGGENLSLNASETENFTVVFDPVNKTDIDGEITLTDETAGFSEEIDVEIGEPACGLIDGRLCVNSGEWMNVTASERGTVEESFWVQDPREGNLSVTLAEDDTADVFTVSPSGFELNESQEVNVSFDVQEPGNFTGAITVSSENYSVTVQTFLESNVQSLEAAVNVPNSIDLGTVTTGESVTRTITVDNTGDLEVYSTQVQSSTFDVSTENTTIPAGQSRELDLSFSSVEEGSGTVELVSFTSEDTIYSTIPVSTTLESGYMGGDEDDGANGFNGSDNSLNGSDDNSPGDSLSNDEQEESSGSGILILIAVVVFILLLAGFVLYTSYIPEKGDPLYSVLGE
ncbi:hypothetical protein [Candidatus Nanohalococcus occultus]|uniref:HYDIN/VesB/CFA65-like Ig-like domain-containing protein n=1 Tax=Candidatus Nanohalococcus occultus TaxID=2978047 RepID=A0ABY8CIF4_9ARCH|nr:hypothetical protein SVXNc_0410 [Candidatus Nanohaloarchaeota archaeon SVXNc]